MSIKGAALALLCAASPLAAQGFEGNVTMNITSESGNVRTITYMLKGGKMRFEPSGGQMAVILDPAGQRMMVIMNAQKMYMQSDFGNAAAAMRPQTGAKTPTITRTGKMETVAGYRCEHVTVADDDGKSVDACMSSELGGFRMPMASNPMAPQQEAGWLTQLGGQTFPLKVQKDGKTMMEVTSIEKKSLDAGLFTAPDGYQSFQMPTMPKKPPTE